LPAEQQLDALLRRGAARRAQLQLRHLGKVLAAAALSGPAQVLLGLPRGGGYAHLMFVYRNPRGSEPFDDSLGLSFKLPVREEDEIEAAGSEEEEGEGGGGGALGDGGGMGDGEEEEGAVEVGGVGGNAGGARGGGRAFAFNERSEEEAWA